MVQRLEDMDTFKLVVAFKLEVYRLIKESPGATRDFRFKDQLTSAAAGVEMCLVEGWDRYAPGEIITFLRYSRASLKEAEAWLRDGVVRGYFTPQSIGRPLALGRRCSGALTNFGKSLEPYRKKQKG
jgi:four helix bundle protein